MPGCPVKHLFELAKRPYVFGKNDCCTVVSDCLRLHLGFDLFGEYRDRYTTQIGFARVLKNSGYASFEEGLNDTCLRNGFIEVVDQAPQDFDLGLTRIRDGDENLDLPCFFHYGLWHGFTKNGMFALEGVSRFWRNS